MYFPLFYTKELSLPVAVTSPLPRGPAFPVTATGLGWEAHRFTLFPGKQTPLSAAGQSPVRGVRALRAEQGHPFPPAPQGPGPHCACFPGQGRTRGTSVRTALQLEVPVSRSGPCELRTAHSFGGAGARGFWEVAPLPCAAGECGHGCRTRRAGSGPGVTADSVVGTCTETSHSLNTSPRVSQSEGLSESSHVWERLGGSEGLAFPPESGTLVWLAQRLAQTHSAHAHLQV